MNVLRIQTRVFVDPEQLDDTVRLYESLFTVNQDLRFVYPEAGLELASVGPILILAGSPERRVPFVSTQLTIVVRSLAGAEVALLKAGADIIAPRKRVPTGWNMRARHPDGLIAEYVEHNAAPPGGDAALMVAD